MNDSVNAFKNAHFFCYSSIVLFYSMGVDATSKNAKFLMMRYRDILTYIKIKQGSHRMK